MTRWQHKAYRMRRLILIGGGLYTLLGVAWLTGPLWEDVIFGHQVGKHGPGFAGLLGTPLTPGALWGPDEWQYILNLAVVIGLLLLAQWAFLRPGKGFTVRLTQEGRPLKTAVITAAVMAMLLTTGGIALLLELPNWWESTMAAHDSKGIFYIWAGMLIIWGFWAVIFFIYWRQDDRYTQLGKMIRALIVGSILEVFIAVPIHVWAARQRECYCCRGTYTTLVLAGTVLLWAFGPGIILLYWREKYRRARLLPSCEYCGYDLRGTVAAGRTECPECGKEIEIKGAGNGEQGSRDIV